MIQINTKAYGMMEIAPEEIIQFPAGLFAFEQYHKFALVSKDEESTFQWLQSLDQETLAFLVLNPATLFQDYLPVIPEEALKTIGSSSVAEVNIFCILNIPANQPEKMTINLQGPILVNARNGLGGQFISTDDRHSVKLPIFQLLQDETA